MPQYPSTWRGAAAGTSRQSSARHWLSGTTPGSMSSRPSKNRVTSGRLRRVSDADARWLYRRVISGTTSAWMSLAPCPMARKLPGGRGAISRATTACGSSASGMKCSTPISRTATGWLRSRVFPAPVRISAVSRRSACR